MNLFKVFCTLDTNKKFAVFSKCFVLFFILVLSTFLTVGCDKKDIKIHPSEKKEKKSEKTIKKTVKICSLSSCATAILLKLGHEVCAVDYFAKDIIKKHPGKISIIGKGSVISFEKLVQLQITHVILWDYQKSLIPKLEKLNIKTIVLSPLRLKDYPKTVYTLGKLVDKEKEAQKLIVSFNKKLDTIKKNNENNQDNKNKLTKVYFELYGENIIAGENSYIGDLLTYANAQSITAKTGIISKEYLVSQKIDVIFFIEGTNCIKKIAKRPGFSNLPAVKNKRIYPVKREFIIEGACPEEAISYLISKLRK